jgi:hypothetical protein
MGILATQPTGVADDFHPDMLHYREYKLLMSAAISAGRSNFIGFGN